MQSPSAVNEYSPGHRERSSYRVTESLSHRVTEGSHRGKSPSHREKSSRELPESLITESPSVVIMQMHRDIFRSLAVLAAINTLCVVASPAPRPAVDNTAAPVRTVPGGDRVYRSLLSGFPGRPRAPPIPRSGGGRSVAAVSPVARPPGAPEPAVCGPEPADGGGRGGRRRGRRSRRRGSRGGVPWTRVTSPRQLKMCSINIQSIRAKTLELGMELDRFGYDAVCVAETWLSSRYNNRYLKFPGYTLIRRDRPDDSGYGGVAIIHRNQLESKPISVPCGDGSNGSRLEALWAKLSGGRRSLIIASVYRPPRYGRAELEADFEELERQLQFVTLAHPRSSILMAGDFNTDMFRPANDIVKMQIDNFINKYNLTQTVPCSTFPSGSLLDLVLTDKPESVSHCGVRHCHYSPHKFVRWFVNFARPRYSPVIISTRSVDRIDRGSFVRALSACDWSDVTDAATVTDQWNAFLGAFIPVLDAHAPQRRVKVRNPTAPPVTESTKLLIRRRRAALHTHGHNSDCYKALNRETRTAIRSDSREYVKSAIHTGGPHTLWRNTRRFIDGKKPQRCVTPLVSPDAMNAYFVDVGPSVARQVAQRGDQPKLPIL